MASLATIFGSGAMTNSIKEIEKNEVIFIIGSNTKETHPVIANFMIRAVRKGAKLIIADPRKIAMCRFAYIWLNHKPGTDVALLNAIAHVIIKEGLYNEEFIRTHTVDFDDYKKHISQYTPEVAEKITGVSKDKIIKAAITYGSSRRAAIYFAMGITQHSKGTENVNAISNLALLTGNIGREATGINPLRGQNNVQGACDAGCLPNVYPGYQRVDIPANKEKFEKAWGVKLSSKIGLYATEISQAILKGELKALYVMGENPVLSDPNVKHTQEAYQKIRLLIVQDIFMTETAQIAHVVLPAACFAEKEGTFINTERRVQRVRRAVIPPGEAKEDLWIISELARRMGYPMQYNSPEDVFKELAGLWPALEGITYQRIDKRGIQWPCPTEDHPGTMYLYKGGFPRGKVPFIKVSYEPPEERVNEEYPFVLSTGRLLFHYHFGSMTGRISSIIKYDTGPFVEINPEDGRLLGLKEGDRVKITSRKGSLEVKARISERVKMGEVFLPLHYASAAVNILTDNNLLDKYAKTPEYKICAVRIEKA